jgi:polar amino acid transport system permease protein
MIMSEAVTQNSAAVIAPPPVARQWTRARIAGHIFVGIWALLFAGLAIYLYFRSQLQPHACRTIAG